MLALSSLPQKKKKEKKVVPTVLATSVFHHVCCVFRAFGNHSHCLFMVRPVLISTVVKTTSTELMLSNTSWAHHDRTKAQTQINIFWLSLHISFNVCMYVGIPYSETARKKSEWVHQWSYTNVFEQAALFFLWGCVGTFRIQALPHSTTPVLTLGKCKLSLRRSNCCNCCTQRSFPKKRSEIAAIEDPPKVQCF